MGLAKYKTKRKFQDTPEPEGAKRSSSGHLRFVIQKHQASHLHYDFRLELDGVLKSWAVPKGPSMNTADKRLAMMVEDHPYDYKDFEGIIPEGNYGAGTVMIWDEGEYHALEMDDPEESRKALKRGLHAGQMKFFLLGKKLQGGFALFKLKGGHKGKPNENSWLLIKEKDEHAIKADITKLDTSARTDRTLEEIAGDEGSGRWKSNRKASGKGKPKKLSGPEHQEAKNQLDLSGAMKGKFPKDVRPMLATLVDGPFDKDDWVYEIKWDGFRAIAEVSKQVRLYSRNLQPFNQLFSPIVSELQSWPIEAVLDGEVVVLDAKGRASFQLLQNYQNSGSGQLTYYVFDILHYNGHNLCPLPLLRRKQILKSVLPKSDLIKYSDHVPGRGKDFFALAESQNLEGIIAKDGGSPYKAGKRTMDWLKIKTHLRQEAVIAGFTEPRGSRKKFGALILGIYKDGEFKYIGHTGGGFNEQSLRLVYNKLVPLITDRSPFKLPPKTNAPVTWVKPKLLCEVSFSEWTSDGHMRQPIFEGLRDDKKPTEVIKEKAIEVKKTFGKQKPEAKDEVIARIDGNELKLTHLSKIYWPKDKYTKGDLIDYYREVSPVMLPYLQDRPENMNRHPNGINGESFYQKDVTQQLPRWIRTKKVYSESNKAYINYLVCNDEATLVYMANLGCIEINPWNSRTSNLEKPDYLVIDLDPEDIKFDKVVEAAQVVHKILDKYDVPNYCKTSGATGLHVYVPLGGKYDYELAKQFALLVATMTNSKLPKTTSLERSPKKRKKQIYLDYLQNRKGQTLAAPYSVRPKPGATVSTPLEWKEVNSKLNPSDFTMKNILKRLEKKGDLFQPILGKGVDLEKILKKLG
jgi:bifunctional non-homologous end joining protein LigD